MLIFFWQFETKNEFFSSQVILTTASALLLLGFKKKNKLNLLFNFNVLIQLGKNSYFIYLIHLPILYFTTLWFDNHILFFYIFFTLLISILNNYLTSRSFLKFSYSNKILISTLTIIFSLFLVITLPKINKYLYGIITNNHFNILSNLNKNFTDKYENSYFENYTTLKGIDGKVCFNRPEVEDIFKYCRFQNKSSKINFFLIGGSHMATLSPYLKENLKSYNFSQFAINDFIYAPGFDRVHKKTNKIDEKFFEFNNRLQSFLLDNTQDSIILISSRYQLYLNNRYFDNQEGDTENFGREYHYEFQNRNSKQKNIFENLVYSLSKLATKDNYKIILLYPIPEVGFSPVERLKNYKFFRKKNIDTSFNVFKDRTKSSFELLDRIKGKNIFRVYPHKIFCENLKFDDRCITIDNNNILYSDTDHPSISGSKEISKLVLKKLMSIRFD